MVVSHQLKERGWGRKVLDFIYENKALPPSAGGSHPFFIKVSQEGINPSIQNLYITRILQVNEIGSIAPVLQLILKETENEGLSDLTRPMENNDLVAIDEFVNFINNDPLEDFIHL